MLGFTLMATGVNILYDRGISAAQCFQAEVSLSWCLHQANAVSAIQYGQKIIVKLYDSLDRNVLSRKRKTQSISQAERKPSVTERQHNSCWIFLSTVGM